MTRGRPERSTTSRRHVLKSLGGALAVGLTGNTGEHQPTLPTSNSQFYTKDKFSEMRQGSMNNAVGFLALPGVSVTSLILNIPSIVNEERGRPIIFVDEHDYARFRGWMLREGRTKQKPRYIGMVYEELRRRGTIQTIDYSKYYSPRIQKRNVREVSETLESLSGNTHHNAADEAAEGFLEYGLGDYQKPLRLSLNDIEKHSDYRQKVEKQQRKMDRGVGNPLSWNEWIANQYMTALEVRRRANDNLGIEIEHVIGQGESSSIMILADASPDLDFGSSTRDLQEENPLDHILAVDTDETARSREILDKMSTVATETVDGPESDFFFIGPRLVLPEYEKIFNKAWADIGFNLNTKKLARETRNVLDILDEAAVDERSLQNIQARADWIVEEFEDKYEKRELTPQEKQRLVVQLDNIFDMAHYSRDLPDIVNQDRFSQAAIYIAASIKMDPMHQYQTDEIYRLAVDFKQRFDPVTASDEAITEFRDRGDFRLNKAGTDWYQGYRQPRPQLTFR